MQFLILNALAQYLGEPMLAAAGAAKSKAGTANLAAAVKDWNRDRHSDYICAEITGYLRKLPLEKLKLLKESVKLDLKYYRSARLKSKAR